MIRSSTPYSKTFPQDPPKRFNVPFPVTPDRLKRLVVRHGAILWPDQVKCLHERIGEFAKHVSVNQGWYRSYRPFAEDFEDCVAATFSVAAMGAVGTVGVEELVDSWFP